MKNISYIEASILKSSGKKIDVKVTLKVTPDKHLAIHMRDSVFYTYKSAAEFLRYIVETELRPTVVRS